MLTIDEVAEQLKCSRRYVEDELRRGNLRGSRLPVGWRIGQADVDAYVAAHMNVSPARSSAASPVSRSRTAAPKQRGPKTGTRRRGVSRLKDTSARTA